MLADHQPWAILPDAFQPVLTTLQRRETAVMAPLLPALETERCAGVALIPVRGPLLPYPSLCTQLLGGTAISLLADDFNRALTHPAITAILLHIDSPGGTVAGIHALSELIYQARGRKPITAYVAGMGASAAYWLASAADHIVIDRTASVGSIGVLSVHTDDRERKARAGIKETAIISRLSPHKQPDVATEAGRTEVQALVDSLAAVFVSVVARNRGVTEATVINDFGQGRLLVGEAAVAAGLADSTGSLEALLNTFSLLKPLKGKTMTESLTSNEPTLTVATLKKTYPLLAEALLQEGAATERARIQAVEAQSFAGQEALIAQLKFDGQTTGEEAAKQVLAAIKQAESQLLTQLKADAPPPLPMPATAPMTPPKPPSLTERPVEEAWAEAWQQQPALQQEFKQKETYFAFMQASAQGQVHLLQP